MLLPLFHLKKLLTSLLLASGLALGAWVWLPGLSGSWVPAVAAPVERPKLAASPVTVTVTSNKDNTLIENPTGSLSNGAGDGFFAGRTGQANNSIRRGVIAFDLSSIPAGSTIISVTLRLNMSMTITGSQPITLHRLLADWGEGSSSGGGGGSAATPGDATWLHRFYTTTLWTTPGGDFTSSPSAALQVGAVGFYQWSSPQMVTDLQGWVDAPPTNFGWLLKGNENSSGSAKRFGSRENSTPANRPTLTVIYAVQPIYLPIIKKQS